MFTSELCTHFPIFSHVNELLHILLIVVDCIIASVIFLILCLTDWEIFERSFNSPHNLKAIVLCGAPVDTVLAVLTGRVEEVELLVC